MWKVTSKALTDSANEICTLSSSSKVFGGSLRVSWRPNKKSYTRYVVSFVHDGRVGVHAIFRPTDYIPTTSRQLRRWHGRVDGWSAAHRLICEGGWDAIEGETTRRTLQTVVYSTLTDFLLQRTYPSRSMSTCGGSWLSRLCMAFKRGDSVSRRRPVLGKYQRYAF